MLIGISGRKQSGKDTVAKAIQALITFPNASAETIEKYIKEPMDNPSVKNVKFAGVLKSIVSLLTGESVESLENEDVKNKVVYHKWELIDEINPFYKTYEDCSNGLLEYEKRKTTYKEAGISNETISNDLVYKELPVTIRMMLQTIGTEIGRQIHSDIWIKSLFKDYKPCNQISSVNPITVKNGLYPKWIISDCRFENEVEAIKSRYGIVIRVNRPNTPKLDHISEVSLDNYKHFNYIIENKGGIHHLIYDVKKILIKEKLINGNKN